VPDRADAKATRGDGQVRIAQFEIFRRRFLAADGKACAKLPSWVRAARSLIPLYEAMVLTRVFDEKAIALQRTGRLGTYASSLGQEAVGVGVAGAMKKTDVLLPSFREQSAQLWRGVSLLELLVFWGGDERGSDFGRPREDFPVCIPVASQFPHAAGVGLAFQTRGENRAAVAIGGDGATSKGDFYEALNLAGAWRLPVVFVINNNQWAISVPRDAQSAARTLAQKAIAAGVPGEQVDGNDIIAVKDAARRALARAYSGEGPSLIEAVTYRLSDHTTADDASRYRDDADVSAHWKEEPVARLRNFLVDRKAWSKADEEALIAGCAGKVNQAVEDYLALPPDKPRAMFDHLFAQVPAAFEDQVKGLARPGDEPHG
jgi:pyruvate dehydrogenase E1 component alpha subunit